MQLKTSGDIGALIRDRRRQLDLSQQDLASRVGVSRLWIVQLEKGKPTAQIGLVLRALKALEIALDAATSSAPISKRAARGMVDLDQIIRGTRSAKS